MNVFKCKECGKIVTHFEKECSYCGAKKKSIPLDLNISIGNNFFDLCN